MSYVGDVDPKVATIMARELERQELTLQMIPSENYASKAVLEACGSVLANKYSEGYPRKRYYQGNEFVDQTEELAIERAKKLFGAEHVNVQPLSGAPANMAIYHALLKPKDKILGMRLDMGGHLTHGHKANFSARYFTAAQYPIDPETHLIDMDVVRKMALEEKPKILVSGASAYPRKIDFKAFAEIAQEVGAYSFADVSHIAGLIAGGVHDSPIASNDVVMTTTHKTLRGPRGAVIMSKQHDTVVDVSDLDEKAASRAKDMAGKIDKAVFPGLQGGPHENVIAAKAVAFGEALDPAFSSYAKSTVENAKELASVLMENGLDLVTGGTDNHLILIDLRKKGIGLGKEAALALEKAGFCTNANTVPYDPSTPFRPSGVRIGTPALTTRGMGKSEMRFIGEQMARVIDARENIELLSKIRSDVEELCKKFRVY